MSDFHAVGGVSATLRALLQDRMELPTNTGNIPLDSLVTIGAPPRPPAQDGQGETARVNLFLYRITENGNLKNQDIPGNGHRAAYGHPPLSLDLHYLITAYGTNEDGGVKSETLSQFLLGSAMRVLHDYPIITEQLETARTPLPESILHQSLRGEFEKIKLTLEPLSLEDLSKVWTALTIQFRPAAAYQVTVVQIESQRQRRFPRPVGEPPPAGPRVYVVPARYPQIDEVRVKRSGAQDERTAQYARIGDTLVLLGRNFSGAVVRTYIGDAPIAPTTIADDRIEVEIPDNASLQPGPQAVEVALRPDPLLPTDFHSNRAVFMLVPSISGLTLDRVARTLQIDGARLFLANRSGETIIGRALMPQSSYRAQAPDRLTLPIPDTLPSASVPCRLSGAIPTPFPNIPSNAQLAWNVTIGATTAKATLAKLPTTLADAATYLQAAIRHASNSSAFAGARVGIAQDRLVVVAGGLHDTMTFATVPGGRDELKLTTGTSLLAYLSADLDPFPALTANQPRVIATIDGTTATLTLTPPPASLAEAAALMQGKLRVVPGWSAVRVTTIGQQLLVILDAGQAAIRFGEVVGAAPDKTTVVELQLSGHYTVRVRVNGAESFDPVTLALP